MSFGRSVLPQYVEYVADKFGKDKKIWMTEFNWATDNNFNDTMNFQAIHGIFAMGYISTAVCNYDVIQTLMWHLWNSQNGTSSSIGFSYQQMLMYNSLYSNDIDNTYYDIIGQIAAHFGWISMVKNDRMYCLNVDAKCPEIGLNITGNDKLQCVYGMGFTASDTDEEFGFVVVNACPFEVGLDLELNGLVNLKEDASMDIWWYLWNDRFDGEIGTEKFSDCPKGKNLWECGEYRPGYMMMNVSENAKELNVVLKPLSLTLGTVQ